MTIANGLGLIILLVELFWNCFFGQILITFSEKFAVAVYDCGWERWEDLSMRKTLNIVLMMAQKNAKLTTGFKEISMEHFYDVRNFLIS